MSLVKVRCVMVPHPSGTKRLTMMNVDELSGLLREGKAVQKGAALWEVLGDGETAPAKPSVQKVVTPPAKEEQTQQQSKPVQSKPQATTLNGGHKPHPHTAGKKHGSKAK